MDCLRKYPSLVLRRAFFQCHTGHYAFDNIEDCVPIVAGFVYLDLLELQHGLIKLDDGVNRSFFLLHLCLKLLIVDPPYDEISTGSP